MSFLRIGKVKNGDVIENFNVYKCDISGVEIPENFPHWSFKDNTFHISEEGYEALTTEFAATFNMGDVIYPYFLYNLIIKFSVRNKRSTYLNKKIRQDVLNKFKHQCTNCGTPKRLEIDHIIPVSRGGKDCITNLQVLCKVCNLKKGVRIDEMV